VVQTGLIRQFSINASPEKRPDVKTKNILVVGNPCELPQEFPDLAAAQREAYSIADKFRNNKYQVTSEIHTGSNAIMKSFGSGDYRILHLAGHGVYQYPVEVAGHQNPQSYTGMVIGEKKFLTAIEIKNRTSIPELVFLNCCYLGKIDHQAEVSGDTLNEFAVSLSEELIKMGVKAVIAAAWPVHDEAARTFAEVFYERLLEGWRFGDAVKEARIQTYEKHKNTNTWAAYQCYGDPAYRLEFKQTEDSFEDAMNEVIKFSTSAATDSASRLASLQESLKGLQPKLTEKCPTWLQMVETSLEISSLIGGAHKRLAQISSDWDADACEKALNDMTTAYWQACHPTATRQVYRLKNYLTAKLILLLRSNNQERSEADSSDLVERIAKAASLAEIEQQNYPDDFWASTGCTDIQMIQIVIQCLPALSNGLREEQVNELIQEYTTRWRRCGSVWELNSVIEHFDFLVAVLKGHKISEQLERIRVSLQSVTDR
jgi:hypothetical protein